VYVSDEKTARRKPFLNTDNELQTGFKASFLSDEPIDLKFTSLHLAIDDLLTQLKLFITVFTENEHKTVVHPFFGELDFEAWKKFQVKHFTHHFKQFDLL
jgi:hydroxymethylglutaryl-CoA reductase